MEEGWVRNPSNCPGEEAEKESGNPAGRELELSRGEIKVAHSEMEAEIGDRLNQTGGSEPWLHSLPGGMNHTVCAQLQRLIFHWSGEGSRHWDFFPITHVI